MGKYIKNNALTFSYVKELLTATLPEYQDITSRHTGYAMVIECTTGEYSGEIVGFPTLPRARRWILNERKARDFERNQQFEKRQLDRIEESLQHGLC